MADDAGALLVRSGLIADEQLLRARSAQVSAGGTLGEHLVLGGVIDDDELTQFYRGRLMVPQVDPNGLARIPARVIQLLPADMASEFRAVPVHLDPDGNLTVAMSDPSNTHAVDEIGFFTGHYVVRAVATQRQIAWCLAHYYGVITPLGETLLEAAHSPADGIPRPVGDDPPGSITGRVQALRHRVQAPITPATGLPPRGRMPHVTPPTPITAPAVLGQQPRPPSQPPELEPRAGEVAVRREEDAIPANSRTDLPAVVIEAADPSDTSPILLDKPRDSRSPSGPQPAPERPRAALEIVEDDDDAADEDDQTSAGRDGDASVVLLSRKRGQRREKRTRLGLGFPAGGEAEAEAGPAGEARGTGAAAITNTGAVGATNGGAESMAAPPRDEGAAPAAPVESAAPQPVEDAVTGAHDATGRHSRVHLTGDDLDDGWGPPGTTIPPPYLGAARGTDIDEFDPSEAVPPGMIPILADGPDEDTGAHSAPTIPTEPQTPATPTVRPKHRPASPSPSPEAELAEASARLVEMVRELDRLETRDQVIERLMDHLGEAHDRVAFFALRNGVLRLWSVRGAAADGGEDAFLPLDRPSTMQDVVGTRLPYRGPCGDLRLRAFLDATLGDPTDEILVVPVDVRGRVVGVVYADGPRRRIFAEHMSVLSRAAGLALERILAAKKSG